MATKICNSYEALTVAEKVVFIGQLQHCVQSDDVLFAKANELINEAVNRGIFKGVKILLDLPPDEETFKNLKK